MGIASLHPSYAITNLPLAVQGGVGHIGWTNGDVAEWLKAAVC